MPKYTIIGLGADWFSRGVWSRWLRLDQSPAKSERQGFDSDVHAPIVRLREEAEKGFHAA